MHDDVRPMPTPTSAPFWEALGRHELLLQRCRGCSAWIHYPRNRCPSCFGADLGWERADPQGVVHTFTVAVKPTAPMFADDLPQVIAVVELSNGVRLTTTLDVDDPASVSIGMAVTGRFDGDRPTLLRFGPADPTALRDDQDQR